MNRGTRYYDEHPADLRKVDKIETFKNQLKAWIQSKTLKHEVISGDRYTNPFIFYPIQLLKKFCIHLIIEGSTHTSIHTFNHNKLREAELVSPIGCAHHYHYHYYHHHQHQHYHPLP